MLLGKRARPPIKRTTSLSEIKFDLNGEDKSEPSDPNSSLSYQTQKPAAITASARSNGRRHSADFKESPEFLKACGLCNRRLVPGRDIYMYRGDAAFCSSECRQQQMKLDEKKDKCNSLASKKSSVVTNIVTALKPSEL